MMRTVCIGIVVSLMACCGQPDLERDSLLTSDSGASGSKQTGKESVKVHFSFSADKDGDVLTLVPTGKHREALAIRKVTSVETSHAALARAEGLSYIEEKLTWDGNDVIFGALNGYRILAEVAYRLEPDTMDCALTGNPADGMKATCQMPRSLFCRYDDELKEAAGGNGCDDEPTPPPTDVDSSDVPDQKREEAEKENRLACSRLVEQGLAKKAGSLSCFCVVKGLGVKRVKYHAFDQHGFLLACTTDDSVYGTNQHPDQGPYGTLAVFELRAACEQVADAFPQSTKLQFEGCLCMPGGRKEFIDYAKAEEEGMSPADLVQVCGAAGRPAPSVALPVDGFGG